MAGEVNPRTVRAIWALALAGTGVWLGLIVLAPWLAGHGAEGPARIIYALFSPLCHQVRDRCFTLGGQPLAVCGRCLGIYGGFLAGLLLYPVVRGFGRPALPRPATLILSTIPVAIDGLAGVLGLWHSPIGLRFATGIVWGTILPFYFVTGAADLVRTRRARREAERLAKRGPET